MSLYFGTTEITKLRNLAPQTGLDITDLWFGSTNVYTVWETYEGTLPATFNANGDDMRQYQIYGNTGGVGDKTVNLFDRNAKKAENGYLDNTYIKQSDGSYIADTKYFLSEYISVESNKLYTWVFTFSNSGARHSSPTIEFLDASKNRISWAYHDISVYQFSVNTPQNCAFIRASVYKETSGNSSLTLGQPETFVPFGYEVDIGVKSGNIFDIEAAVLKEYWINDDYDTFTYHTGSICYFIPVSGNESYTITDFTNFVSAGSFVFRVAFTNEIPTQQAAHVGRTYRKQRINSSGATKHSAILTNNNYNYLAIQVRAAETNNIIVSKGTTPPDEYQPYYNTVIPIYIRDEPLDKDEYVDYQTGKIYRMIDGTLTPTDPPVALPALPTCEGETIVDYVGQSVAPEKVFLKYRKEGF